MEGNLSFRFPVSSQSERYRFAYRFLGPIFLGFCERLRLAINTFPANDTIVLFIARSGLRIRLLLEEYLRYSGRYLMHPVDNFFVSRLSVSKGCYVRAERECGINICREFKYADMNELTNCVFHDSTRKVQALKVSGDVSVERFLKLVNSEPQLNQYLYNQSKLFHQYFDGLTYGRRNVVLVDTGWAGSTQAILMKAYRYLNIYGLYFGKWDYYKTNPEHFNNMMGLIIEDSEFSFRKPQVAILYYHHLIEEPLEPQTHSVEWYISVDGKVVPGPEFNPGTIWPSSGDRHFSGIIDYVQQNAGTSSV